MDLNKQIGLYSMRVNTKSFPVHAVAKFSGVNPATDMYDDIHPNSKGEKTMAKRWYDAIKIHLKKLS
jgi:acyl-CoA thioesterase I